MSRFNGDDYDENFPNEGAMWAANTCRHLNGRAGQKTLRELRDVLLALPDKRLIQGRLADEQGQVCTLGALAVHRGVPVEDLAKKSGADDDGCVYSWEAEEATINEGLRIGLKVNMAVQLAAVNDDTWAPIDETPEQRYERVLAWVESQIKEPTTA